MMNAKTVFGFRKLSHGVLAAAAVSAMLMAPQAFAQRGDGAGGAGRAAQIFDRFDSNKDGFITEAEFNEAREKSRRGGGGKVNFAELDDNRDGKLSREEFNAGLMEMAEKAREAIPQFEDYDTNKDGRISEAEFNDAKAKRQEAQGADGGGGRRRGGRSGASFADMDANKDGSVTKEEFDAHRDEMREKMQERRKR